MRNGYTEGLAPTWHEEVDARVEEDPASWDPGLGCWGEPRTAECSEGGDYPHPSQWGQKTQWPRLTHQASPLRR